MKCCYFIHNHEIMLTKITETQATQSETFFSDLFDKFDDINIGDKVKIVGKDEYKGHIGIVVRTSTTSNNDHIFTVQLQTTGDTIDRVKNNIKRFYG